MMRYSPNPHDIEPIERRLEAAFTRVKPRDEFIGNLRQRLIYPAPEIMAVHPSQMAWWILLGIAAGLLLTLGILLGTLLLKQRAKT